MYCSSCGASNPEGSDLCGSCGARLSLSVPAASEIPRGLRAMRVGDILDETIRLFRQNFRTFVVIIAIVQLPLVVLNTVQLVIVGTSLTSWMNPPRGAPVQWGPLIFFFASSVVLALVGGLAFVMTAAALASAISQRYLGHETGVGRAYRLALKSFWRMLAVTVLVGSIIVVPSMTIIGIPIAIYMGIRLAFVVQAVVLERCGVGQALSRSWDLVKGSWWRVVGIVLVTAVAQNLVVYVPSMIIGAGIGAVGELVPWGATIVVTIINSFVGAAFGILAAPLSPTVMTLLYYDLRIRKEGFDLQLLAGDADQELVSADKGRF